MQKWVTTAISVIALLTFNSCGDDPGEGVPIPIPDVPKADSQKDTEEPPPISCVSNDQCAAMEGTDACRIGKCELSIGECTIFETPNCCVTDEDCDDGDPVTNDTCDGVCKHEDTSVPCQTDADCVLDNKPCITFECDQFCTYWQKADCCLSASECDDGDDCTQNLCENFKCESVPSDDPLCCGETVFQASFTGAIDDGFEVDGNGQPVEWHFSEDRSHSDGGSVRFADPATGTYLNPTDGAAVPPSQGELTSPPIAIPEDTDVTLSFWVWVDIEPVEQFDLFYVKVLSDMDDIPEIWTKAELGEQFETWVQVSVDVSAYGGQTVRFVFGVDTIDGTVNSGTGVFIDDVTVTSGCSQTGCTSNEQCEDGDPCTENACGDEGLCGSAPIEGCCKDLSECAPPGPCQELTDCIDGECIYEQAPGCCNTDEDCEDGDPCTVGACTDAGTCSQALVPDCCSPSVAFEATFQEGDDAGIEIENNQPEGGWNINDVNPYSEPLSLHYGDPVAGGYAFGGVQNSGIARLPAIELPQGESASLTFWAFLDIEDFPNADVFEVRVRVEDSEPETVWTKDGLDADQYGVWIPVEIDLTDYAGKKMRVQLTFDTIDPIQNDAGGVFLDDIKIAYGCGDAPCNPALCDDGDVCTSDFCGDDGECHNEGIPGCGEECDGPEDCNDGDDCTADFCTNGACQFLDIPGCGGECDEAADCDDDDVCTADFCNMGQCQNLAIPGCGADCTGAADCDDDNVCTADFCTDGVCQNLDIPGCGVECTDAGDCADDDDCTIDYCSDDGVCVHEADPDCAVDCEGPADCDDGNDCTADFCSMGTCLNLAIPGCGDECQTTADCNDDNTCTADFCFDGQCQNLPIAGCGADCETGPIFSDSFDLATGNNLSWLLSPASGNVGWHIDSFEQANTPPGALYYGNPEELNYVTQGGGNSGTATSSPIAIAAEAKEVTLTFNLAADIEQVPAYDLFDLAVIGEDGTETVVWTKDELAGGGGFGLEYVPITVDLTGFTGQTIQLSFRFDTLDGILNTSTGIFVDDVLVTQTCEKPQCDPDDPTVCDDGNACTSDACSASGLCSNQPIAGCCTADDQCGDNNACTTSACVNNQCQSQTVPGCCTGDAECADADACTTDLCAGNVCVHLPIPGCGEGCESNADCDDDNPCTENFCAGTECVTVDLPGCCIADSECGDTNPCTTDSCTDNTCVNAPIPGCGDECAGPADCTDGEPCTQALCVGGQCQYPMVEDCCLTSADCADNNPCTQNICSESKCSNPVIADCCTSTAQCNDEDICTVDSCEANKCVHVDNPTCGKPCVGPQDCADGDPCTENLCVDGKCQNPAFEVCECATGADCADDDPCTQNVCINAKCSNPPEPGCCNSAADCADGDACTKDVCTDGVCSNPVEENCCATAADCGDGDPCTQDVCAFGQCQNPPEPGCCATAADCSDADVCTTDMCVANQCQFVAEPGCCSSDTDCNDNKVCTADQCLDNGCVNTPKPTCCSTDADCADSNPCTKEACGNNQCASKPVPGCCNSDNECGDGNPCTKDSCTNHVCVSEPSGDGDGCCVTAADCDDGNACTAHACTDGVCQTSAVPDCCDDDAACEDGNKCTANACTNNSCTSTPIEGCCSSSDDCNDNVACTFDACDAATGVCTNVNLPGCCALDADCVDADVCTTDTCVNNSCQHGSVVNCCKSDADCAVFPPAPCQVVSCIANQCFFDQDPTCCTSNADCADDNICTTDACTNGACTNTVIANCCSADADCDDANSCTNDSCNEGTCSNNVIAGCCSSDAQCDDADPCTKDACEDGACTSTAITNCCKSDAECDDGNACTADACTNGVCGSTPVADCCTADSECPDEDDCTIDACTNNKCTHEVDPSCCTAADLANENFTEAPEGWASAGDSAAHWQIANLQSTSPPTSLWFGNETTGDFSSDGASAGTMTTSSIALAADESALMTFNVWLDIETNPNFDLFEIRVITSANGEGVMVWNKSAVPNNQFQSWVPVKINLTSFAGQSVQVVFDFNSLDTIQNSGEGIFIDDFVVAKVCEDLGDVCVFAGECDDSQVCTTDACVEGECQHNAVPDCCTADLQCNDSYACTADTCVDGTCVFEQKPGCCVFNGECDDANPCTTDTCTDNTCTSQPVGGDGCCTSDAQCNDDDPCTKGSCEANQCKYVADSGPGCCEATELLTAAFDDATLQGFTVIQDGSAAKWSVQSKRFFSPPFSMYFGIPGVWNYETEPAASGVAISPSISVPLTAAAATLTFQTWFDTLQFGGNFGDIYNVKVLSDGILKTVWTMPSGAANESTWLKVEVDLTDYKGKSIQVYWNFQAVNVPFGQPGEGVFVDDVDVSTSCN